MGYTGLSDVARGDPVWVTGGMLKQRQEHREGVSCVRVVGTMGSVKEFGFGCLDILL